ncbi:phosphatidate cytidylyltransferase [Brevundimonas sp. 2R-24]|uniref:Phosphatidate cytidylyltransferase n=1 Tax=Peiella sedimenti TaxID=3061083 RepID=A0ABT8SNJ6_9CAUL|nr:phosphatidate cytidylyltransferase [Caulobacteraceae bacterium XZ-24]
MKLQGIGLRAASTAVLAPAAIAALYLGGLPFMLMIAVSTAFLAFEWTQMSQSRRKGPLTFLLTVTIVAGCIGAYADELPLAWAVCAIGALILAVVARTGGGWAGRAWFGVLYLAVPIVLMVWLRLQDEGGRWTILLFAITWGADIAAYLAGSAIGGAKLAPRLSPNKTWAGFIAGLVAGSAVAALVTLSFAMAGPEWRITGLPVLWAALVGLAGALATMSGDLFESALKRRYGVKDSGDIIPGHGGLLDRVDGLLFAAVVVAGARVLAGGAL